MKLRREVMPVRAPVNRAARLRRDRENRVLLGLAVVFFSIGAALDFLARVVGS